MMFPICKFLSFKYSNYCITSLTQMHHDEYLIVIKVDRSMVLKWKCIPFNNYHGARERYLSLWYMFGVVTHILSDKSKPHWPTNQTTCQHSIFSYCGLETLWDTVTHSLRSVGDLLATMISGSRKAVAWGSQGGRGWPMLAWPSATLVVLYRMFTFIMCLIWLMFGMLFPHLSNSLGCFCPRTFFYWTTSGIIHNGLLYTRFTY